MPLTTLHSGIRIASILLLGSMLAGCGNKAETAVAAEPAADQVAAAQMDAPAPPPAVSAAAISLKPAQLIGRFSADGNTSRIVEFKRNGTYVLTGGVVWDRVQSKWSLEADGTRVRLHHDHQQPEDLLFAVVSADKLVILNNDGTPTAFESSLDRLPE